MKEAQAKSLRPIIATALGQRRTVKPGFTVAQLNAQMLGAPLDPFLNFDHFRMSQPIFLPHPHAGFSAVTYMFEDSEGSFVNRDSLGDRTLIGPGDLHWTQAAHGSHHEEIPSVRGEEGHGLQIFVNLAAQHKQAAPRAFHLTADQIPVAHPAAGVRVRVVTGAFADVASPLTELLTPVTMLDVTLQPGSAHRFAIDDETAFAVVVKGKARFGKGVDAVTLSAESIVAFGLEGEGIEIAADGEPAQILLCAGTPLRETVFANGPFIATDPEQMRATIAHYQQGGMRSLSASF